MLKGVVTMAKKAEAKAKAVEQEIKPVGRIGITDLVEAVFQTQTEGFRKTDINDMTRLILRTIRNLLVEHNEIALPDLFILKPTFRAERTAHNPQKPGETITVPAGWTLKVKPSRGLKESMNPED